MIKHWDLKTSYTRSDFSIVIHDLELQKRLISQKKPRHANINPSSTTVKLKIREKTSQVRPRDSNNNRAHSNPPLELMDISHNIKLGE
jgi:hypothetical protein